jgi:hypothetical protein
LSGTVGPVALSLKSAGCNHRATRGGGEAVSEAVIGFLGVLIGAIIAGAVTLLGEQFALKREREARQAERDQQWQDRHDTFQLNTLLALQDAVSAMRKAVYADFERKTEFMAEHQVWLSGVSVLLPKDWAEADDLLIRLKVRVDDDNLQMLVEQYREVSSWAMTAEEQSVADSQSTAVSVRLEEINARIGTLLSRLH